MSLSLASFSERLIVGEGVARLIFVEVSDQRGGGVGVAPDLYGGGEGVTSRGESVLLAVSMQIYVGDGVLILSSGGIVLKSVFLMS